MAALDPRSRARDRPARRGAVCSPTTPTPSAARRSMRSGGAHARTAARSGMKLVVLGLTLSSSGGTAMPPPIRALLKALRRTRPRNPVPGAGCALVCGASRPAEAGILHARLLSGRLRSSERWRGEIARADAVIVGSYVPEACGGRAVRAGDGARRDGLLRHRHAGDAGEACAAAIASISSPGMIPGYELYLSFTGGPTLGVLERRYGSPAARALYCSVGSRARTRPARAEALGPLLSRHLQRRSPAHAGTAADRAGAALPDKPLRRRRAAISRHASTGRDNVERIEHLPPADHAAFYCASASP